MKSLDLAEVLAAHRPSAIRCYPMKCRCGAEYTDFPAHQAQAWLEACTITTVEQLDSLPLNSVIRDDNGNLFKHFPKVGYWLAEGTLYTSQNLVLPVLLIWHPK